MNTKYQVLYKSVQELSFTLGGELLTIVSKPGIPSWDGISISQQLVTNYVIPTDSGNVLLIGSGNGAAAACLAKKYPDCVFDILDINIISQTMTTRTLLANQITNAQVLANISVLPENTGLYDMVVIDLPKGRNLTRRFIVEAYYATKPGGFVYIVGPNNLGIKSSIKDANDVFQNSTILAYKKGNRIAYFKKSAELNSTIEWIYEPGIAPGTWVQIKISMSQSAMELHSLPGIFSYDHLDDGTRLLIEHLSLNSVESAIDLGCGYGVIGILIAKSGASRVELVDSNLLAIAATNQNIQIHGITNAFAWSSDVLEAISTDKVNLIATNPPFHSGSATDYQITQAFLAQSWETLESGGRLVLVANRFIRYDNIIKNYFSTTRVLAENNRFYVIEAQK